MKKKRGRPLKYTPKFINKLRSKLDKWIQDPAHWWICDFAIENDLWEQRIYDCANKNEKMMESLKKAEQIQKSRLVQLALARKIDTAMAIFALKNVAGWRDNQNVIDQSKHNHTTIIWQELNSNGNGKFKNKNQTALEPMENLERFGKI